MAEAVGFILSIAGLYSSCIDAFEQIRAARSFGRDYEILSTRFDVRKARFLQWGDGVGLLQDAQDGRHPHLDSPSLRPAVERVLHCIEMLLTDTECFKSKYGLREMLEQELHDWESITGVIVSEHRRNLFRDSYARFQGRMKKQQKEKSMITKTKWAIVGRSEFQSLVSDLDEMIEDLYKLIPVQPAFRRLMVKEDIDALPEDLAALKLVQEACAVDARADDKDTWLEAASLRVEATELGTQDYQRINEWLDGADDESVVPIAATTAVFRSVRDPSRQNHDTAMKEAAFSGLNDAVDGYRAHDFSEEKQRQRNDLLGLQNPPSVYICGGCNTAFSNKTSLSRHQKEHCERTVEWVCRLCAPAKHFFRKDKLSQHHIDNHGEACVPSCKQKWGGLCERHLNRSVLELPPKKAWGCPCCLACFDTFAAWTRHSANHPVQNNKIVGWSLGTMVQSLILQPYIKDAIKHLPEKYRHPAVINANAFQNLKDALERHKVPDAVQVHIDYRHLQPKEAFFRYVFRLLACGAAY
jgi:hypothetical protein